MNIVNEIGRLTKEVEVRATTSGKSVTNFTIAVPRFRRDDGADFLNCEAWGKTAENMGRYVKKGDRIGITGHLRSDSYEKDGHKVYVTKIVCDEVEFLEYKRSEDQSVPDTGGDFSEIDPADVPF